MFIYYTYKYIEKIYSYCSGKVCQEILCETSSFTPPKINMEHNHGSLEDHFPF